MQAKVTVACKQAPTHSRPTVIIRRWSQRACRICGAVQAARQMNPRFLLLGAVLGATTCLRLTAAPDAVAAERTFTESAKANAFFDRIFDEDVDRSPLSQGYLGIKKDHDKWDDFSETHELEGLGRTVQQLAELKRTIHYDWLDAQAQVSYRLFAMQAERTIEGWKWHNHGYVFTQMSGMHSDAPAFLINYHQVDNAADAQAYITRLRALPAMFDQLMERSKTQAARGIMPPKFVYPILIEASREVITGTPFDASGKASALQADFAAKVNALKDVDAAVKKQLLADAAAALLGSVKPAYEQLIAMFEAQEKLTTDDDGVWKLPEGRDYYNFMLRQHTTTTLSADEIHELGLREVARIHAGMAAIKEKVGFKGDFAAFLAFMRGRPAVQLPDDRRGQGRLHHASHRHDRRDARAAAGVLRRAAEGAACGEEGRTVPRAGVGRRVL